MSCVPPLRNRDMVVLRSWLDPGREYYILSHSVSHQRYPPRQGFVRALSHLAGGWCDKWDGDVTVRYLLA